MGKLNEERTQWTLAGQEPTRPRLAFAGRPRISWRLRDFVYLISLCITFSRSVRNTSPMSSCF